MTRTRIKICGITNIEDALTAVELGADALGFIFVERSKRCVVPSVVRSIVFNVPPFVSLVGVFVDVSLEKLHATMAESGLNVAQLHGEESPEYVAEVRYPVIKTFRPRSGFAVSTLAGHKAQAFLFDTYSEDQSGGTGKTFDWDLVRGAEKYGRVILSGGITPANAAEAIRVVQPYALDVSSGVEIAPGKKDRGRMNDFFQAVRDADRERESPC